MLRRPAAMRDCAARTGASHRSASALKIRIASHTPIATAVKPNTCATCICALDGGGTKCCSSVFASTMRSILQRPIFLEAMQRHAAGEDHRIHREAFRPQVRVEEVEQEDEARGEQGLVAVDDVGRVQRPARQEPGEEVREPQHQARDADHADAPEHREVVELLPVRPAVERRPRAEVQEVLQVAPTGPGRPSGSASWSASPRRSLFCFLSTMSRNSIDRCTAK